MYHLIYDPPRIWMSAIRVNGELYQRDDDAEDTVRARLEGLCGIDAARCWTITVGLVLLAQIDGIGKPEDIERTYPCGARHGQWGGEAARRLAVITSKSREEIAVMRTASRIVAEVLVELAAAAKPGVVRLELDRLAEELTLKKGARPAFKGYKPHDVEYRHSLCVSIN